MYKDRIDGEQDLRRAFLAVSGGCQLMEKFFGCSEVTIRPEVWHKLVTLFGEDAVILDREDRRFLDTVALLAVNKEKNEAFFKLTDELIKHRAKVRKEEEPMTLWEELLDFFDDSRKTSRVKEALSLRYLEYAYVLERYF